MKLETLIKARLDGTVLVEKDGTEYKFEEDGNGAMVCEVADPDHAAYMMASGNFYPADGEDLEEVTHAPPIESAPVPKEPIGAEPGTVPAASDNAAGEDPELSKEESELEQHLATLDKEALLAYIAANNIGGCSARMNEATLRAKIIAAQVG